MTYHHNLVPFTFTRDVITEAYYVVHETCQDDAQVETLADAVAFAEGHVCAPSKPRPVLPRRLGWDAAKPGVVLEHRTWREP